jgi:hypothetical protein
VLKEPDWHQFHSSRGFFLFRLHLAEQYTISSQFFSHFLRHKKGRSQTGQIFSGSSFLLIVAMRIAFVTFVTTITCFEHYGNGIDITAV